MVSIRKSNGKHGQVLPIHKPVVQVWNGNETRQELQNGKGQCWSGSYLAHLEQDMGEEVCHGGLELQGTQREGRDASVGALANQTCLQAAHQGMLFTSNRKCEN